MNNDKYKTTKCDNYQIINPGLPTERKYGYKIEEDGLYLYEGKLSRQIISKSLILEIIKTYKSEIKAIMEDNPVPIVTEPYGYSIFGEDCFSLEDAVLVLHKRISSYVTLHNLKYSDKVGNFVGLRYRFNYIKRLDIVEVYDINTGNMNTIYNLKDFALFLQQEEFKKLYY